MTLQEGIKLQNELLRLLSEVGFNKYLASTRLGIEALKQDENVRQSIPPWNWKCLPGETKE